MDKHDFLKFLFYFKTEKKNYPLHLSELKSAKNKVFPNPLKNTFVVRIVEKIFA